MRKLLLSLCAAAAGATPVFAQPASSDEREGRVEAREEPRRERAQVRRERSGWREPAPAVAGEPTAPRIRDRQRRVTQSVRESQPRRRPANVNERGRPVLDQAPATSDSIARRLVRNRPLASPRQADQPESLAERLSQAQRRLRPPEGARPDRPAPPRASEGRVASPQWHRTWRHDRRYDWRRWRDHNRSLFRFGIYFDPFGWRYHRRGIGWRLWPSYYDRHYWLDDPWMYRLPYAPWPYRWIRYYDDALLVNTITGRVVDVEHNFFW